MKTRAAATLLVLLGAQTADAAFTPPPKHPEPPRFIVPEGATLPLRSTAHAVEVVGPVAHVTVTQVYENTGEKLLDATYVFPGSPNSAVASLVMRIGERTVTAVLKKKEEARADFEAARRSGHRASLLEQRRPNVFEMALTNIRPGETVEVELGYTELLVPEEGQFELALPGVVAPRFGGEGEDPPPAVPTPRGTPKTPSPWLQGQDPRPRPSRPGPHGPAKPQGPAERGPSGWSADLNPPGPPAKWSADIRLRDGLGVVEVTSPTHPISPRVDPQGRIQVALETPGDAELVLRWRLASGTSPAAGLTFYEGQDERFFMMTVAPPQRVDPDRLPPREVDFLLDVSCSMRGFPLDVAKVVMRESLTRLRPTDRFNIHFFASGGWTYAPTPQPATPENVQAALRAVDVRRGGGGTQLVHALEAVAKLPRAKGLARSIVVVTDGLVSFERAAFAKIRERIEGTVFTLGIGANVNRMLVEGVARAGGGVAYVAHDEAAAKEEAARLVKNLRAPVMTDVKLSIQGLDAYDLEPPSLPDLYADRPVVVVGKYRGAARGSFRLSGMTAASSFEQRLSASETQPASENAPLRALWARRHLQRVADDRALADGGADAETITALGLKYGLLTEHTSFVAVDSEGGAAPGDKRSVVQTGPHPKGMAAAAAPPQFLRTSAPPVGGATAFGAAGLGSAGGGVVRREAAPRRDRIPQGSYGRRYRASPRPPQAPGPVMDDAKAPVAEASVAEPPQADAEKKKDIAKAGPKLKWMPVIVEEPLDSAGVEKVLASVKSHIRELLGRARRAGEAVPARFTVELRIGANGQVTAAKILEGSGAAWEQQVQARMRGLRFPASTKAGRVRWPIRVSWD
ncbi:MAG: VIT domain-containing protein [Myxococcota bacterium]